MYASQTLCDTIFPGTSSRRTIQATHKESDEPFKRHTKKVGLLGTIYLEVIYNTKDLQSEFSSKQNFQKVITLGIMCTNDTYWIHIGYMMDT